MIPRNLQYYFTYRFFTKMGMSMKMTILGYYLYEITGEALSLGLIGLYEALPRIALALPAGYIVEQLDKKKVLMNVAISFIILSLAMYGSIHYFEGNYKAIEFTLYITVFLIGCLGSMRGGASVALFAKLIPKNETPKYSAISSNALQLGSILGPILGGFFITQLGSERAILMISVCLILGFICLIPLPNAPNDKRVAWNFENSKIQIHEGLSFVYHNKTLLWALMLDLFVVLFGGCVALLPIFSRDILQVGATEYGWLRAALPIGSALSLLYLAKRPIHNKTGQYLIISVFVFGLAIIGFGISKWFWLSMFFLFTMGAADAVSVVIRGTMLLLETPDEMKARVTSINSIFISSSNELGAFESGITAQYMGAVRAVIFGGSMTLFFAIFAWNKAKSLMRFEFKNYVEED